MYSYIFEFYRPGKEFYTQGEMFKLNSSFLRAGFEADASWTAGERVRRADFNFSNGKTEFCLVLGPADDRFNGLMGQFSITEEQLKRDPWKNTEAFSSLASVTLIDINALFAWGDHELEIRKLEPFLNFDRIGALAWNNILSRELVERLGGVKNVLFQQTVEEERKVGGFLEQLSIAPRLLTNLPTETVPAFLSIECLKRFPGAILKGFETFPAKKYLRIFGKIFTKLFQTVIPQGLEP